MLSPVNTNKDQPDPTDIGFKLIEKEEISEPAVEVVKEKALPLTPAEDICSGLSS